MEIFLFSFGAIFLGLLMGYTVQILVSTNRIKLPIEIETLQKSLQKIGLLFFNPISFLGAIWAVELDDIRLIVLPFIGIFAIVLGGFFAFLFAKAQSMTRKQTGAYIVSGGFTNIGSIGGLLCFIFWGEAGFALVSFYKLFELFSYYGLGFPIAKSYGLDQTETKNFYVHTKKIFADPFIIVTFGSVFTGFVLNLSGFERPIFYETINAIIIPTATILLLASIGMTIHFERIRKYVKEGLFIGLIKFVIVPIISTTLAYLVGFAELNQGLPLKVVLILSSMPVGFIAMVPPTIYDLDVDLAYASWFVTNVSLIFIIPCLQYLVTLF